MRKSLLECKVLIVEDVYDSRMLVHQILGRLGVTVIEATDGLEGVRLAQQEVPDLILMDLSLPLLDGWEATRRLKADLATAHIPVIIVTAHAMRDEAEQVQEIGCAGYVQKPLDPTAFGKYVAEMLQKAAPGASLMRCNLVKGSSTQDGRYQ